MNKLSFHKWQNGDRSLLHLEIGHPYTLAVSSDTARKFDLREDEIPIRGTIGMRLVSRYPAEIQMVAHSKTPYVTIPLFAWLPESYILRNGQPHDPSGWPGELLTATPEETQWYAVKNGFRSEESYLSKVSSYDYWHLQWHTWAECRASKGGEEGKPTHYALIRPRVWAAVNPEDRRLRYGDSIILKVPPSEPVSRRTELSTDSERRMTYGYDVGDAGRLTIEPLPSIIGMFIDPRSTVGEPVFPRKDTPFLIKTRYGYMRAANHGADVFPDGEVKCREQRWTFDGL